MLKTTSKTKFTIPVLSFIYISNPEKHDFDIEFNNDAKLREIDILSKINKKMYKSYILKNASHCVFNKERFAKYIIDNINKLI